MAVTGMLERSRPRRRGAANDSDAELVTRTLAGDLDAFAALMARYRDVLGRYAIAMLGSRADAKEAVQDSFIWLFAILVNRCRSSRRRLRRRERVDGELRGDVAWRGDEAAAFEWREEIARALERLRPRNREAFLLRYVEELDYAEMARRSGTREATLRMRVKRASDRLRELLQDVHAG